MLTDVVFKWFIRFLIVIFWFGIFFIGISYKPAILFDHGTRTSLNILAWPQIIDRDYLAAFEDRHQVTVHITYCENNEEMLAKLSSAHHDYDLVMPSNFFLKYCIENRIIQKLDHAKLPWFGKIDSQIRNLSFDPGNEYSVPCFWSIYGIGVNRQIYKEPFLEKSWSLIFNPSDKIGPVGMLEELPQTYAIMGLYLYHKLNNFTPLEHETIVQKLIDQKRFVLAYTDMRVEYLLISGECAAVFSASSDMQKMVKLYSHIEFFVPQEGSFAFVDSFTIAAQSQKKDLAYAFLEYLYDEMVISAYADKFEFISPLAHNELLAKASTVHYFERIFSEKEYEDLWITIKAA